MRVLLASLLLLIAAAVAAVLLVDRGTADDWPPVALDHGRPLPQGDAFRSAVPRPPSLNPFTSIDAVATRYVLPYTHDALYDRDPATAALRPAVALGHEISADGRTITFRLRDDLRFSDGAPLTVEDLRFTIEVSRHPALEPKSDGALNLSECAAVDAADARTLVCRLEEPRPSAVDDLGTTIRLVQRAWFVAAAAESAPDAPPGSTDFVRAVADLRFGGPGLGAYRIASSPADEATLGRLDMVQNRASWRYAAQPRSWNLGALRLEYLADEAAKMAALDRQQIDWIVVGGTTPQALLDARPWLAEHYRPMVLESVVYGHWYVLWNVRHPPLDRPEVRRALGMLFDRERILRDVLNGAGHVARGWFRPGMPEYPRDDGAIWPFDRERAARLLADAGYGPEGEALEIEMLVGAGGPQQLAMAEIARAAFRDVGVSLVLRHLDSATLMTRVYDGDYQATILVETHRLPLDPYDYLHDVSPELEDVLSALRRADGAARIALADRFHAILRDQQPQTLLVHPSVPILLHERYRGTEVGSLGLAPERFWVPPEERLVALPER